MSDQAMRLAERVDPAAALAWRIRCAEIAPERLAYAAALGHPTALQVAEPAELNAHWRTRCELGASLLRKVEAVRWGLDLAERAMTKAGEDATNDPRFAQGITAANAWVDCPCEEHRIAAWEASLKVRLGAQSSKNPTVWVAEWAVKAAGTVDGTWAVMWATRAVNRAVESGVVTYPVVLEDLAERLLA
jgi:hypothetical protein